MNWLLVPFHELDTSEEIQTNCCFFSLQKPLALEHTQDGYAQSLLDTLRTLREDSKYCDVLLYAGDHHLPAHRCVLAANGAFFYSVFSQNQSGDTQHVSFPATCFSVLKSVVDFMYSGKARFSLADADELLSLSQALEMTALRMTCAEAMRSFLDLTNWFDIKHLAS